jgi:hypothetical protein
MTSQREKDYLRLLKLLADPDIPDRRKVEFRRWWETKYVSDPVRQVKENTERWKKNQTVEREYSEYKEPIY